MKENLESKDVRLIITNKCNYKCQFCHNEWFGKNKIDFLTPDEIEFIYSSLNKWLNINSATISWWEPLTRKDFWEITNRLIKRKARLTLVSNWYFVDKQIEHIGKFEKINISIHTFDQDKYKKITWILYDGYNKVINNIILARSTYPDLNIKLNTTLVKWLNTSKEDLETVISFANKYKIWIKFIELFWDDENKFPQKNLEKIIIDMWWIIIEQSQRHTVFKLGEITVTIAKIFCASVGGNDNPWLICSEKNDFFIWPDWKYKPCRENEFYIDLKESIIKRSEDELIKKITSATRYLCKNCLLLK